MARTTLLLVAALLLAVPATAAPGEVDLLSDLPLAATGDISTLGDGALLATGDSGTLRMKVEGDARLERVVHRAFGFVRPDDPELEVTWSDSVERHRINLEGALFIQERRDDFTLLVSDADMALAGARATYVGALTEPKSIASAIDRQISLRIDPPSRDSHYEHQVPAGHLQARTTTGEALAEGTFEVFVSDAVLLLRDDEGKHETIQAHFRTERHPGTIYNPLEGSWSGPGEHTEYIQEYLLVRARDAVLELDFTGTNVDAMARSLTLDGLGDLALPSSTGTITVDGEETTTHELRDQDLVLEGMYTLTAADPLPGYQRAHVTGSGDFTKVSYGAVQAEYDWGPAIVAAGLGALVLAGAAWLLAHTKTAAGALGGFGLLAGYARVSGEEVLEHPARGELYERIKADPGMHFQQIADASGHGASTLNYHLRVLEKNQFVNRVRDGRYVRFFDRRSGAYSGARKHAASALRNPTTASIAQAINAHPGVAQCDLAEAFGLAPSTINWHVRRLIDAGLVLKRRENHYARYYAGDAWATLPLEEQSRHGAPVAA